MKFKIWDKVRVRTWEDMEKEFWLDDNWNIQCNRIFIKPMKKYCWKELEITNLWPTSYIVKSSLRSFSDDMLEPIEDEPKLEEQTQNEFKEGELVEVSDNNEYRGKRIYIHTVAWKVKNKYICVSDSYEIEYKAWEEFSVTYRKHIRKIQPKKTILTKQQIAERLWLKVEDLEITE